MKKAVHSLHELPDSFYPCVASCTAVSDKKCSSSTFGELKYPSLFIVNRCNVKYEKDLCLKFQRFQPLGGSTSDYIKLICQD